jgi:hypothetical protein
MPRRDRADSGIMRALSIRQPYAELILRGVKTVEYRSRPTRVIGQRFHIYAPLRKAEDARKVWSRDLAVPAPPHGPPPGWMVELAEQVGMIEPGALLPTGVIVGSAVIEKVTEVRDQRSEVRDQKSENGLISDLCPLTSVFAWHLAEVERAGKLRKPTRHPQPGWFRPF